MDTRLSFQADLILLLQSPQANDHQLKVVYLRILKARQKKHAVSGSWRMDETYIKIKGEWWYYYRAVDKSGANALALHHINTLLWFSGVLMLN